MTHGECADLERAPMAIVVGCVPTREGRAALSTATQEAIVRSCNLIAVRAPRGGRETGSEEFQQLAALLGELSQSLEEVGLRQELREATGRQDLSDIIIDTAEEVGATLIVIGLRRRSKVGKLFLGSNVQRILLDAACPVLAVKASERGQ